MTNARCLMLSFSTHFRSAHVPLPQHVPKQCIGPLCLRLTYRNSFPSGGPDSTAQYQYLVQLDADF